jgi:hypothetical protein
MTRHLTLLPGVLVLFVAGCASPTPQDPIQAFQVLRKAGVTKLPADDQKVLRDVSRFHEINAVTNLPACIFALRADDNGRLAEPGQEWQVGCVVTDDTLAFRRMIWAVTDGELYVVHYEQGGYAYNVQFIVAKLKAGKSKPSFIWHGTIWSGKPVEDYPAFLKALQNNEVADF